MLIGVVPVGHKRVQECKNCIARSDSANPAAESTSSFLREDWRDDRMFVDEWGEMGERLRCDVAGWNSNTELAAVCDGCDIVH